MLNWIRLITHLLRGWTTCALRFPKLDDAGRDHEVRRWTQGLFKILRIQHRVEGALPEGACAIAANHISWLDIFVVFGVRPVSFVSKAEAGEWPLIGTLVKSAGTAFIDRGKRHAVHAVIHALIEKMHAGRTVAFFPEGTTTDGGGLLPFHANLFEAARRAPAPIVPITIRYRLRGARCEAAAYVGEMTLAQSMSQLFANPGIEAEVIIHPAIAPDENTTRHQLAERVRDVIASRL
ncbi:hypothetical protein IP84_12040 [beta proteobacterium AAP99]|nr:hypothetical protein IP84_12040 [beta proteobacterium AAP99]